MKALAGVELESLVSELIIMFREFQVQFLRLSVTMLFFWLTNKVFLCTKQFKISSNPNNVYSTKYQNENMQRSNRTELCDATRNKKQSRFETHLGSDATFSFVNLFLITCL